MLSPAKFIDNPDWAKFLEERLAPQRTRHLPTHEDCSQLDVEKVQIHLRCGGTLGRMTGYEERPGQIDMAGTIAAVFNAREHLMVEAGTGVGKSLAYLIPSILWAWTNDTPVVISTATRNLQSQLMSSDIPKALAILGDEAQNFQVALLKGRTNYLCLRALGEFFAPGYWTMSADEQAAMPAFIDWLTSTPDGDLDGYEGLPRNLLTCTGDECSGRRCPYYTRCFVYKARKASAEAHLVIVNHSLVLSEATAPGSGILPSYGRIIIDEAHNLENIATEYLSYELSMPALTRILNRLIRKSKGKFSRSSGVISSIERQFQKGAFSGSPVGETVLRTLRTSTSLIVQLVNAADELFEVSAGMLKPAAKDSLCRYRVLNGVREYSLHGLFKPYEANNWDEARLREVQHRLEAALAALVNNLHELRELLEEATPEGEFNYLSDLTTQLTNIADSLVGFANEANCVLGGEKESHAYWVERLREGKKGSHLRLVAAPLSVAEDLKKLFYEPKDSVILCSATLRVGNDFKYMSRRLGCGERFRLVTAESPFDYFRQAEVMAADWLPDPAANFSGYVQTLADLLTALFKVTEGRALVLFTSYEMMVAVANHLRAELTALGLDLVVQGEGVSRETMTQKLKADPHTVLFGAQSFWEGVDIAGASLSCVVLARLPFAMVGDPIIEARSELIAKQGGSAFRDYALPEAVIKFRQGFGRLIRTKTDSGIVVISDPRIVTKNYGAIFRKSIPATVHTVSEASELLSRAADKLDPR